MVVWHQLASVGVQMLGELRRTRRWPSNLAGVVLLKGLAYAGSTSPEEADRLAAEFPGQVHIISYAIPPSGESPETRARFTNFQTELVSISIGKRISYDLLEPPRSPEDLVAVYLALVAEGKDVDVLDQIHAEVWKQAGREFAS